MFCGAVIGDEAASLNSENSKHVVYVDLYLLSQKGLFFSESFLFTYKHMWPHPCSLWIFGDCW